MTAAAMLLQAVSMGLFALGALSFAALLKGCFHLRRAKRDGLRADPTVILQSPLAPEVSILTAPPDSSPAARAFVRRLLDLQYSKHQVVVVLNGPAADGREVWAAEFPVHDPQRLLVVAVRTETTAQALQAGVEAAAGPLIGWVAPGCEFASDLLPRLVGPMLEEPVTAAVWSWSPVPPSDEWCGRFAALESLRSWLGRCAKREAVPGSAMLIRKDALLAAGGFPDRPADLMQRLQGAVAFAPECSYRLQTPGSWGELRNWAARDRRWLPAALETAAYPVAAAGWWFRWIDASLAGVFLLSTVGVGIVISMGAVVLWELTGDRDCRPDRLRKLFLAAVPENLGYRQVRNLWLLATYFAPAGKR